MGSKESNQTKNISGGRSKKLRKTPRTEDVEFPEEPDELFFQEVMFNQHQQQIRGNVNVCLINISKKQEVMSIYV